MYDFRACGANILAEMFEQGGGAISEGLPGGEQRDARRARKVKVFTNAASLCVRSEEEIQAIVKKWSEHVHPRARELFKTEDMLVQTLSRLARGIGRHGDPVFGPEDRCACWIGTVTAGTMKPAISMPSLGRSKDTYVNRLVAFIFADDESFEALSSLPHDSFEMTCGNRLCVSLAHISPQ